MRVGQRAGNDDIRRRADHRQRTAGVSGDRHRHHEARTFQMSCRADTGNNRDQGSGGTGVGQYRAHDDRNRHDAKHQAGFTFTGHAYNSFTDKLRHAGVEQSRTDDEHAGEQNNCRVGQTGENHFFRDNTQQTQRNSAAHRSNRQRDNFSNKANGDHCKY